MSKTCTCPSGDGSLRRPCPSHPPACAEIKPDTSLYTDAPSRLRATALVAEACAVGSVVQLKSVTAPSSYWRDESDPAFTSPISTDYRIKPEPREFWVNECLDGNLYVYATERAAVMCRGSRGNTIKVREVLD